MGKPLTNFRATIRRAMLLLDSHDADPEAELADDLVRSAVVFSIAGFDHYFTSRFCDILVPYLKNNRAGDDLIGMLGDAGLNTRTALELSVAKRPFRKIRTLVQDYLSHHTTHRTETIDELFRSIGLKNLCENAQKKARRKNLITRIQSLVNTRNSIAHTAHLNSRGNPQKICSGDVRSRINDMVRFVEEFDSIVAAKIKK